MTMLKRDCWPAVLIVLLMVQYASTSTVDGIGNAFHCMACRIQCHSTNQASICSDTECICIPHDIPSPFR